MTRFQNFKIQMGMVALPVLFGTVLAALVAGVLQSGRQPACAAPLAAPREVVINEVAWAGTLASSYHEWIELKNNTPSAINLSGWHLTAADGTPSITLNGQIPPKGYFLLARTNYTNVVDVPADMIYTGALGDSGEMLTLTDNSGQVIDTANSDGGGWPAGTGGTGAPPRATMERANPRIADVDLNWATNDGIIRNGRDANGNPVNGTPKARNSAAQPMADLVVAKSGPDNVLAGGEITYTITLGNEGEITATDALITDTLPLSVTFVRAWPYAPAQPVSGTLVWTAGSLPAGASQTLTLVGRVGENASGLLTNHVVITSSALEVITADNAGLASTQIIPLSADVSITKSAPISLAAGAEITYIVVLENVGLLRAANVRVTDTLPLCVAFVRHSAPFPFAQDGNVLTWQAGDLPASSGRAQWSVTGLPGASCAGTITNTVQASAAGEQNMANNFDQAATLVVLPPPLVLISGVLYDGYQLNDDDESVEIINVGPSAANLQDWRVTKGTSPGAQFPPYTLGAYQRVWAAKDALAFFKSFGFWPDFAVSGATVTNTVLALGGSWPVLSNAGGDVQLKDDGGAAVDALLYATDALPAVGWGGPGVYPSPVSAAEGQIIARIPDEKNGLPLPDANTAADWIQYTGNYTAARRVLYPGWDMDVLFWPLTSTAPATITLGVAPDNAYEVVRDAIRSAQSSIEIEAYTLQHYGVVAELEQKAGEGVRVTVLLEGEPVGGVDWQELWACREVERAGGECRFMHDYHPTGYRLFDRYDLIHAKFVVLDRQRLVISTQNFSGGGMPDDDKSDGTYGSRGYVLYLESPELAARAGVIFDLDSDWTHSDIAAWPNELFGFGLPPEGYVPITASGGTTTSVYFPAQVFTDATYLELFTSPEASLRQSDALLGLLARAGKGDLVYVEQLYEYSDWGDQVAAPNVRLKAYIDAARRGAKVRVLLNSGQFDLAYIDLSKNFKTTAYVNALARQERLDLQARMGDPTHYGIHSKMVLVRLNSDGSTLKADQSWVHVGSINGSETSCKVNRELAVQIESHALYDELARVFGVDWHLSGPVFLPLILKDYPPPPPPPPVDYIVVSEVYYSNTVALQWVELYNPTTRTIDLSDYKIGDAETADRFEGMYRFPAGTLIGPDGVLVIAYDGTQMPQANFQMCQTCGGSAPVMSKYAVWGRGDWTLAGHGDQVLLLGPDDTPVDVIVYGDGIFPGVTPHPGVSVFTHSLERRPAMYDTDDCSRDLVDLYPPDPGNVNN